LAVIARIFVAQILILLLAT